MTEREKQHRVSPHMTQRARHLRQDTSTPERILWGLLRGGRLKGWKFRRQYPIGPYVADFYCTKAVLVVELDGDSHIGRSDYDERRVGYIQDQGLRVLRIGNDDMLSDPDSVAETILQWCEEPTLTTMDPHPSPLPERERG